MRNEHENDAWENQGMYYREHNNDRFQNMNANRNNQPYENNYAGYNNMRNNFDYDEQNSRPHMESGYFSPPAYRQNYDQNRGVYNNFEQQDSRHNYPYSDNYGSRNNNQYRDLDNYSDNQENRRYGNSYNRLNNNDWNNQHHYQSGRYNNPDRFSKNNQNWQSHENNRFRNNSWNQDYQNNRNYNEQDRGFLDRAGDEVKSWFGDEEAARRRQMDDRHDFDQNRHHNDRNWW